MAFTVAGVAVPAQPPSRTAAVSAQALAGAVAAGEPEVAAFYRARQYQPLWIDGHGLRPQAADALRLIRSAADNGLDATRYRAEQVAADQAAARSGRPADLARAELSLSSALAAYVIDLRRAPAAARPAFADPQLRAPQSASELLARAGDLLARGRPIGELAAMNPIYEQLRAAWLTAPDGPGKAILRANLERARALPPVPDGRFVLVNAAAARLWLYQDGRADNAMRVAVGKLTEQTPVINAVIRFAVANPYWNVPPDLVREKVAPHVLSGGRAWLDSQHMEALSDWSRDATVVDPDSVDWAAVAAGERVQRVRQRPGADNMMGAVKFMFPNPLGVYLHDTPNKAVFASAQRTASAGCVRLEDARTFARWLMIDPALAAVSGEPEQRLDLARPIPVFITYLTVMPQAGGGLVSLGDPYRRDPALLAALRAEGRSGARGG